jgi:cell division protein FtsB
MRERRRRVPSRRSQAMVEVVILVAVVGLGIAWVTWKLPAAISEHYKENQKVLASPL